MKSLLATELVGTLENINSPRVQEIAQELAGYGLAIAMPHLHDGTIVRSLPDNIIQYEENLNVSFRDSDEFERSRKNAFPVMWRSDPNTGALMPCAWCHDD